MCNWMFILSQTSVYILSVSTCQHTVVKDSVGYAVPAFKEVLYWQLGSIVPEVERRAEILLYTN